MDRTFSLEKSQPKTIVVSAVNLVVGGTLTILRDCLTYLSYLDKSKYRVVALVNDCKLIGVDGVEYIELKWPKKSWLNRLWCEYVSMYKISKKIGDVYLWLSLHDTTPNVKANKRAVYCHNPFPFYEWRIRELYLCPKVVMFSLFSYLIYRINIHKNNCVVMQQGWIRDRFAKMFGIDGSKMLVALPSQPDSKVMPVIPQLDTYTFLYASSANSHKNFEALLEASEILEHEIGPDQFRVVITLKGDENKYAKWLFKRWGHLKSVTYAGFMNKEQLYGFYNAVDCFVFPSKVETWGLPVSEFGFTGKPMLVADKPYAYETAAKTKQTAFFNPEDPSELMMKMKSLVMGDKSFLRSVPDVTIQEPVAHNWKELFDYLLA